MGAYGNRPSWEVRRTAYSRLLQGCSLLQVAHELDLHHVSVGRWARMAGMQKVIGRTGGIRIPEDREIPLGTTRQYRRLTLADRAFIQAARSLPQPISMRRIAAELGVAASTVSRELTRHSLTHAHIPRYLSDVAHHRALLARSRPRPGKLSDPWLRESVIAGLNAKHSPQQIAHRLRLTYPHHPERHVSHETIYQALYVQGKGALRHELTVVKALRSGRTGRVPHSKLPPRSNRPWLAGARLSDRPAGVADRAVPGHWEGDLVIGPENSGLVTLVERRTRFALIAKLPGVHDSRTVTGLLTRMIRSLPSELVQTLTWDQGQEMAEHRSFTIATGCRVFFCDPHSPWQRGSNENLNGLIRDFYPKGTNFNAVTVEEITHVQDLLNDRPRRTLGYYTPREKLGELFTGVALAP